MRSNRSFRDLDVWQEAMALVEPVYQATRFFPSDERFGLTSQLRRAAVSIPSNIGEGSRRRRDKPFRHHLEIALGSQGEVEVQIEIARRLGICDEPTSHALLDQVARVGRMLNGLIDSLTSSDEADNP